MSRALIENFHHLGLSISYNRVLHISTASGNNVCTQYEEESIISPQLLRKEALTTTAVDSIDHNPSSKTSKESFHGTQHMEQRETGVRCKFPTLDATGNCKILKQLPTSYSTFKQFVRVL